MVAINSYLTLITPPPVFKFDFLVVQCNNNPVTQNFQSRCWIDFPVGVSKKKKKKRWFCSKWQEFLALPITIKHQNHISSFLAAQELFPQSLFHSRVGSLEFGSASGKLVWNWRVKRELVSRAKLFLGFVIRYFLLDLFCCWGSLSLVYLRLRLTGLELNFNSGAFEVKNFILIFFFQRNLDIHGDLLLPLKIRIGH